MQAKSEDGSSNCSLQNPSEPHSDRLDISISEAEKRETGALNYRDFYTVYLIETKGPSTCHSVWRRYSELEALRSHLAVAYPYVVLAPLPEKKVMYAWSKISTDTTDPDFVDRRRAGLENFLLRLASHPVLSCDNLYRGFLQPGQGWKEHLKDAGVEPLRPTLKQPDARWEAYNNYQRELERCLGNVLRVRARLADRRHSLHKLHAHYGRMMSEWSAREKEMGDGLQRTGHFLDSFAASIDAPLEEEELIADQLKEYLFYAGALEAVCRRHDVLQAAVERAQSQVQALATQREHLNKPGLWGVARLFGGGVSEEGREERCHILERRTQQEQTNLTNTERRLEDFSAMAQADVERFQLQKVTDLQDTLGNFVQLQAKMCRKDLQTWIHIRDCLEAIPS